MKIIRFVLCLAVLAALAAPAAAQVPTGNLAGHVTDGKEALPGVTVTVTSPSLQGARTAITSVNGDYIFRFLPPGDYTVKFQLQGFQALETTIKISAAQDASLDASMPQAKVAEQVTVTGSYETISTSAQAAATVTQEMINKLPVAQNFVNYAALAPGTTATGPGGNIVISGAQSWENLMTVNGVSIQDNIRLTPGALYIEDAIQETTTQTAAISAEYGRFAGGVVNMLTKSGGNEMHGSFRWNMDSSAWAMRAPTQTGALNDTINNTYMATLGGWFVKDHLWYFAAYRTRKTETSTNTYVTLLPYNTGIDQQRYEGKLTFAINPNHRIIGSYLKVPETDLNNSFGFPMDLASLYDRKVPSDLIAANYTGVLTDNFFIEGQYSRKTFTFIGSGSRYTDRIKGTLLIDLNLGNSYRYWSPTFCGVCDDEKRDNKDYLLKASYFLSTSGVGTHDIVVGFDEFDDQRFSNNHQSGSDFRIRGTDVVVRDGVIFPQWIPITDTGGNTVIRWTPIFAGSKGNNFWTKSAFVNDKWRLTNNWSFNVGFRYDKNDGKDADNRVVANDSAVSPRLGVSWDPKGDGDWQINAGYAQYVAAIANGVADSGALGGQPATIDFAYKGDPINPDKNAANLTDTTTALTDLWAWFDGHVDLNNWSTSPYLYGSPFVPGAIVVGSGLTSTNAKEWSLGVTKRLGTRGMVRMDLIDRTFGDFYDNQIDRTTGTITIPSGTFDKSVIVNNNNTLSRQYRAMQFQFSYRASDRVNLGGNYTLSRLWGNFEGENTTSGPITAGAMSYPEYFQLKWAYPKGNLLGDQRNKARAWVVWDMINSKHNRLSMSVLQSYLSGTPYGAAGTINVTSAYVTNPGYLHPPTTQTYYFTNRDGFLTAATTQTDISFNYAFKIPALGSELEFFVEPRVTNVFNEKALQSPNSAVYTSRNSGKNLAAFNPFKAAPVECAFYSASGSTCLDGTKGTDAGNAYDHTDIPKANWMKSPTFGKSTSYLNYQTPRTFTLSVGMRF